ncbi:hypothetical protein NDN08_006846 [Rhodosorus marinus]|uniref:Uncharacterized protein n=1 Tax=Rhodosorus marinus TaxID=101924 RepID=A0AAV8UP93_9RHOD|nr:hypothetical protein NDN08_006846 [Rhodosorus marinus]
MNNDENNEDDMSQNFVELLDNLVDEYERTRKGREEELDTSEIYSRTDDLVGAVERSKSDQNATPLHSSLALGPGVLGKFKSSVPVATSKDSEPTQQEGDLRTKELERLLQRKDGEISILRGRQKQLEEEKRTALQRSFEDSESARVKTLKEQVEQLKEQIIQQEVKLELSEQEAREAQRQARESHRRQLEAAEREKERDVVIARPGVALTSAQHFPVIPNLLGGESLITSSTGPRKPKIRRTSTTKENCERQPQDEKGKPERACQNKTKDSGMQTRETAALVDSRANEDLGEIYVDEGRLETSSVFTTRKLELSMAHKLSIGSALSDPLLLGDAFLAESFEPLRASLEFQQDSKPFRSILESMVQFNSACREKILAGGLPVDLVTGSDQNGAFHEAKLAAMAGSTDLELLEVFEGRNDHEGRGLLLLVATRMVEHPAISDKLVERLVRIAGKHLSTDLSHSLREKTLYVLLRIGVFHPDGVEQILKSPLNVVARCVLLLDQTMEQLCSCGVENLPASTSSGRPLMTAANVDKLVIERVLSLIVLLLQAAQSAQKRSVSACLGLTRYVANHENS